MFSLLFLSLLSICSANLDETKSPRVFWRKSDTPVTVGHNQVSLEVHLVNPCAILSTATVHEDLYEEAMTECKEQYDRYIMHELELMCPKKRWSQALVRKKRLVGIVLALVAVAVFCSIGIGGAGLAVATSDSARLDTLEERENEVTRLFNSMEDQVKSNHEAIRNITAKFNTAISALNRLQDDHDELKGKSIRTSFAISYLVSRFAVGKSIIQEAAHLWKLGRVSSALIDFFNVTLACGDKCPIHLARAQRCGLAMDGSTLYMEFASNVISDDLTLVEADPFKLMLKTGNKTCTVKYTGPSNAILSESNQCVYAVNVNQPTKADLFLAPSKGCMPRMEKTADSKHFSVDHCERSYPLDEHNFIQVKPYHDEFHLYCPGSNLTVDGHKRNCPDDVFSLPAKTNFAVNGVEFVGSRVSIVHTETLDPIFTVKTNWHLQPSINWTSMAIEVNPVDDFQELHLSEFHHVTNYWSTIGCVAALIIVLLILICMLRKRSQPLKVSVQAQPAVSDFIQMRAIENGVISS